MTKRYEILYERTAAKAIKKLERSDAKRLISRIEKLAEDPRPEGSIKLVGGEGQRRIRVGDFRIIYRVYDDRLVVIVLKAGHRRSIYD